MRRSLLAALSLFIALFAHGQAPSRVAPEIDQRVETLLARMTLKERLGQLLQYTPSEKLNSEIAAGAVGCVFGRGGAAETNALQRVAIEQSRLGIPLLFAHDVIHGYRTIFPIPLGIASTWDPASAELAARVAAREARASGIRWTFAPMVDIARDPRWGRITEGAGEDPVLGSAMAAAYVRGYQGTSLSSSQSIMACAKHYAGYGAGEAGRDYNTVDLSEARLREVYLPPFKAAVDAGVWTIMTAFHALNGVPATANAHLLRDILRDEWRFRGFVDSDYTAIEELIKHGVASTPQQAALLAINAGVDMNMVGGSYATLEEAVTDGRLRVEVVNDAVRRILRAKFTLGLFEQPFTNEAREASMLLTKEHLDAARAIAQKSIVLLKNDGGVLPLSKTTSSIAVIGPLADSREDMLGSWYASGKPEEAVSVLDGVKAKVPAQTRIHHVTGDDVPKDADVVLLVLGETGHMSGEASSRASLDLPGNQQQLLETIVATGKPVVLVVMSGRPLTIAWAAQNVPAIVWPWFPGTQGGHAIADVLFGDVNPSGKLPVTFPRSVGQIPIYHAQLPTGRPEIAEEKYTSKYIDSPNTPLYPFGHGLSYTRFEYSDLRVNVGERTIVSVDVKNAGSRAGDEVVQLYVNDPVASVSRPVKELKAFRRITLAPGEKKRVELTITRDDLRFWANGWKFEPGLFKVWVGGLEGSFELK